MKTAQELVAALTRHVIPNGLCKEAAMLRTQAAEIESLKVEYVKELDKVSERNYSLRKENEALKADAERYRCLRVTTNWVSSKGQRIDVRNSPELWDESIDAMIEARKS